MRSIIFGVALLAATHAFAQDQQPTADTAERVEVTGSHIKRVDVEGVAPVQTVSKDEIQKKGYDNLGDVVRDLGVSNFGSNPGGGSPGNSSTPGNASISIHGMGAGNTLVLLNGVRLPQDAQTGVVDINMIPMAAVERIEILKDGASALYGSDALGGVVNVITVKDFSGTQVDATQSLSTNVGGGKQTNVSVVNGINSEKLNLVTTLNYRYNQAVMSRDREWVGGNPNSYSTYGSPGSYVGTDGNWHASKYCAPSDVVDNGTGGSFCKFRYSDYSEEAPLLSQFGIMTEAHYEMSSDVRLTTRLNYTHRYSQTIAAAPPGPFDYNGASLDGVQTAFPMQTTNGMLKVRPVDLGERINDYNTNGYGGLVGTTIQLPKDWTLDVSTTANYVSNNTSENGYALVSELQSLINSGQYNPLAPRGQQFSSPAALAAARYSPWENADSLLAGGEVKASGELTELPAGPLGAAFGVSFNFAQYHDHSDAETTHWIDDSGDSNVLGGGGGNGAGQRNFEALYAEFSIPVLSKTLELQAAARYDHYSDFGGTFNPKVGFLYHANRDLLIRGSWGTGFRAPLLTEMYAGPSSESPEMIDYKMCQANPGSIYCQAQQYSVLGKSNPNLKQETSNAFNFGAVYEPTKSLSIGIDAYYTNIDNVPDLDFDDLMRAELLLGDATLANKYGVIINRGSDGSINTIVAPLQNTSKLETSGVDIDVAYTLGKWKFVDDHNQLFFYKTSGFPEVPVVDKLGWAGRPSFRNTASVNYSFNDNNNVTFYARFIPSQKDLSQTGTINAICTFDLAYALKVKNWGEFTVTLINILNTYPPVDSSDGVTPVNYGLYDMNLRQVLLGWKYKFN